jgi:tRNA 2-selenouridine synthase
MPLHRIPIAAALAERTRFDTLIDARSPSEYAADHLPEAVNWPSLDDEQRHLVGTDYAQVSPFEARKLGAVMVARNIAGHLERELPGRTRDWRPLVYCWRGGQRSGALAHVLSQVGFEVHVLDGGYRDFRRHVVAALADAGQGLELRVICGETGSGKSRLLQALQAAGEQVLDLEALACHRGSVLGAVPDQPQPTQKRFESLLWQSLTRFDPARIVYVESESRTIGKLRLPEALLLRMRAAPCVRLQMPQQGRVDLLLQDYAHLAADPTLLASKLDALREVRGHVTVDQWQAGLRAGRLREVIIALLVEHYDPIYLRSMARNFAAFAQAPVVEVPDGSVGSMEQAVQQLTQTTDPPALA